jgi:hypothetical protein
LNLRKSISPPNPSPVQNTAPKPTPTPAPTQNQPFFIPDAPDFGDTPSPSFSKPPQSTPQPPQPSFTAPQPSHNPVPSQPTKKPGGKKFI